MTKFPRETKPQKQERVLRIIEQLEKMYPDATCALNHSNPLELLVATILSAQCTDERVNIVTKDLFRKYPSAKDYASASLKDLEKSIKSINFFRNKAKALKSMAKILVEEHRGQVPESVEELIRLPGVGRKTANVVLGNAFHVASGIVVDTHVGRLSRRLGLTKELDALKVERDLLKMVPQEDWISFSHWLIWHGRSLCKARKASCGLCGLVSLCPQTGVD